MNASSSKRWRASLWAPSIAVLVVVLLVWLVLEFQKASNSYQQYMSEVYGFREMSGLARRMIDDRQPGVIETPDGIRIRSFGEFYTYVARVRPHDVASVDAPNPFPGILPGNSYGRLREISQRATEKLIWNSHTFERPTGRISVYLKCDGSVFQGVENPVSAHN